MNVYFIKMYDTVFMHTEVILNITKRFLVSYMINTCILTDDDFRSLGIIRLWHTCTVATQIQTYWPNASWALRNNLAKIYNDRNHIVGENFMLKLYTYVCPSTKFQLEILIRNMVFAINKFRENILESSWNISETPPGNSAISCQGAEQVITKPMMTVDQ